MKTINRDKIQRMVGQVTGVGGGGGGRGVDLAGYASQAWVEQQYISKEFFLRLFSIHGHNAEDTSVNPEDIIIEPNDTDEDATVLDSIEAKAGLWTKSFVSALGVGGSGTGTPFELNEPLNSINNMKSLPTTVGHTIVWNGNGWEYRKAGGGDELGPVLQNIKDNSPNPGDRAQYKTLEYDGTNWKYGYLLRRLNVTNHKEDETTGYTTIAVDIVGPQSEINLYQILKDYLKQDDADDRYVKIDWFKSLFKVHTGANDAAGTEIEPNKDLPSEGGFNIESLVGIWTKKWVSALGANGSGSGGGTPFELGPILADINMSPLHPTAAGALYYNGSAGSWSFMPLNQGIDVAALQNYLDNNKYIKAAADTKWWGQTMGSDKLVKGDIKDADDIYMNKGKFVKVNFGNNTNYDILGMSDSDNTLLVGWGIRGTSYNTTISGGGNVNIGHGTNANDSYGKYWTVFRSNGHVTINTGDDTDATRGIFLNVGGSTKTNRLYLSTNPEIYLEYDGNGTTPGVHLVGAGLWSDSFISALGSNPTQGTGFDPNRLVASLNDSTLEPLGVSGKVLVNNGGTWSWEDYGAGGGLDENAMWTALGGTSGNKKIDNSHLSLYSLSFTTSAGTIEYNPTTGGQTIDLSSVSGNYLPLTGGTLSKSGRDILYINQEGSDAVGPYITFKVNGTDAGYFGYNTGTGFFIQHVYNGVNKTLKIGTDGSLTFAGNTVLDSANSSVSKSGDTLTVTINGTTQSLTNSWRGIQNNLTSTSTTDSLSALQGNTLYGYITKLQGNFTNGVANSAAKLTTTSKTLWGNTYWTSGGVPTSVGYDSSHTASLSYVKDITMSGNIEMGRDRYICFQTNDDSYIPALGIFPTYNVLNLGYEIVNQKSYDTNIYGNSILMFSKVSGTITKGFSLNTSGNVCIGDAYPSSTVGDILALSPASSSSYTAILYRRPSGYASWSVAANNSNNFYWYTWGGGASGTMMSLTNTGSLTIGSAKGTYIKIGGAKLTWTDNGLECDQHFYSKGAVSALGSNTSGGGGSTSDISVDVGFDGTWLTVNVSGVSDSVSLSSISGGSDVWKKSDFELKSYTGSQALGWRNDTADATRVVTSNALAYWNGLYDNNSGNSNWHSNLAYCIKGKFGSIVTFDQSSFGDNIVPDGNGSRNLGSSDKKWATVYCRNIDMNGYLGASIATYRLTCSDIVVGSVTASSTADFNGSVNASKGIKAQHIEIENGDSHTDEINNTSSTLWLQYNTGQGVSMCYGRGNVAIGDTPDSFKFKVNGTSKFTDNVGIATDPDDDSDIRLKVDGDIKALSFIPMSDIRKKDIVDYVIINRIEDIARTPIFNFTWKNREKKTLHLGTSAQYIQDIFPNAVTHFSDGDIGLDYGATALAAAVFTARKVVDHELRIKQLEQENAILRKEIEELKAA